MNKKSLLWFVGFLAFIALMCSGFHWLLTLCHINAGFLGTIRMIANIVLTVLALVAGWLWLASTKMNKTLKVVLQVLFVIFAILSLLGNVGIGI